MFDKKDSKLAMMRIYKLSCKIIKFCKQHNSEDVITHLIIISLNFESKTIRDLSEEFDVEHSWMSTTVGKLEKQGIGYAYQIFYLFIKNTPLPKRF